MGIADFHESDDYAKGEVARVGVVVDRPHQGQGLGEGLLSAVAKQVTAAGYTHFQAYVKRDNAPQLKRMESARIQALGARELTIDDGETGRVRQYLVPTKPEYRNLHPQSIVGRVIVDSDQETVGLASINSSELAALEAECGSLLGSLNDERL